MKGKVIDLFSRKPMDVPTGNEANDESVMEGGMYLGHIHEESASIIRQVGTLLEGRAKQIDHMVAIWEQEALDYYEMIGDVLGILNVEGFDPATHEMQVSEEGHVWIVKKKGDK